MTVFSRILIDSRDRRAMYVFGSLERLHAVVARATNSDASGDQHRVLWRLDKASHGAMQRLYIVSPSEPDRSVFEEELGVNADRDCSSCDYGPFLEHLESGQEWAFRVTVNPTHSVPSEGFASRGRRQPIVRRDEQAEWLFRKFRKIGCHMTINRLDQPEVAIRGTQQISFRKRGTTVVLTQVTFEGILSVDDPNTLCQALVDGIGSAKAYGCGLLTLAPLQVRSMDAI